jgi:O-antigen/teichoic acid export membrane protein
MHDLKHKTVRGGFAKLGGQAANSALRLAFLIILTRLLDPADFGLVGSSSALPAFNILRCFNASCATSL